LADDGISPVGDNHSPDWQVKPQVWRISGPLFLLQSDLDAAFEEAPKTNRKPFPAARGAELKYFLVNHAREQERLGKPNNDDIAQAAQKSTSACVLRESKCEVFERKQVALAIGAAVQNRPKSETAEFAEIDGPIFLVFPLS
jgi:hypothetical protein